MMITAELFHPPGNLEVLICLEDITAVYEQDDGHVAVQLRDQPEEFNLIHCKGPIKDWETAFNDWEVSRGIRNPFIPPEMIKIKGNEPEEKD